MQNCSLLKPYHISLFPIGINGDDATEIMVEINLYTALEAPIYIFVMYMMYPLSDNSVIENSLKNLCIWSEIWKSIENKCTVR